VDPVPDPLLLRKSGSAGNRTRAFWITEAVQVLYSGNTNRDLCKPQSSSLRSVSLSLDDFMDAFISVICNLRSSLKVMDLIFTLLSLVKKIKVGL
jgi:hypothetical protein